MATKGPRAHESLLERIYVRAHTHFPYIVDCQTIPLGDRLEENGFVRVDYETVDIFTMPVAVSVTKVKG